MPVTGKDKICKDIAEAFGIKNCRYLELRMHIGEIVTVKAEFYPEIDGVKQLNTIFKQYELVEKQEEIE